MMVIFTSRSEKKSLLTVRRILDNFADRIGNDTWQTLITQEGLKTVHTLLRKNATKSTAVSCRWIRSRNRSELLWIVGNRDKFNEQGIVPVNTTKKNILHKEWEGGWPYLPQIKPLVAVAALLHDWGKASDHFQGKLRKFTVEKDPYRHEWISCKMLEAVAKACKCTEEDDGPWMQSFLDDSLQASKLQAKLKKTDIDKAPYEIPPIMQLLIWSILTHHRLPIPKKDDCAKYQYDEPQTPKELMKKIQACWDYQGDGSAQNCLKFKRGMLFDDEDWQKALKKWLSRLMHEKDSILRILHENPNAVRPMLIYMKEALMLADHYVSSKKETAERNTDDSTLYANTKDGGLCETLSHHLVKVAEQAVKIVHHLPLFVTEMNQAENVRFPRSKGMYQWQDKAVEAVRQSKKEKADNAYFILNMASTGCGKTTANAKIMQALSKDGKSMRYTLALGLRSLTLQTGTEYKERMHLSDDELAVIIGSRAVQSLYQQDQQSKKEESIHSIADSCEYGGAGEEDLLSETVSFEDNFSQGQMDYLKLFLDGRKNNQSKKNMAYLFKPVLVTTIDQIIGVTETTRGGRGLLPFLRLLSSDLVIDEIDDFSPEDLIAIARLVHMVGVFGRNLVLSSATIPPDLAVGLYQAYQDGLVCYNAFADEEKTLQAIWVDEFRSEGSRIPLNNTNSYMEQHESFVKKRAKKLGTQIVKRKAKLIPCQPQDNIENAWQLYVKAVKDAVLYLHEEHHIEDKQTKKTVSFGLLRFANIDPCVNMAISLAKIDWGRETAVYLMCYHSRQVLLLRHEQERYLDSVLRRKQEQGDIVDFKDEIVRQKLSQTSANNVIFLVVATPVEEIGRDHDFDWAIIEPSSYRSIIQLAGRIRRHRPLPYDILQPNIGIMEFNWRAMINANAKRCVFKNPGFEKEKGYCLKSHDMKDLVLGKAWQRIDAIPRIIKSDPLHAADSLIDLEHKRLEDWRSLARKGPDTVGGWQQTCWWMTGVPQSRHHFREGSPSIDLYYRYDEKSGLRFYHKPDKEYIGCEDLYRIDYYQLSTEEENHRWIPRDYMVSLQQQAAREKFPDEFSDAECLQKTSERYGQLMLTYYRERSTDTYWYSNQFGLFKKYEWVYL